MLKPVARWPLVSHGVHDACQTLSIDRLGQSRCPRCMVETVDRSPLVSHGGQDSCYNLSLDRYSIVTVATMQVRNCGQIAFSWQRQPRCTLQTVARSPLVSQDDHDAQKKMSIDRLQLVTMPKLHATNSHQSTYSQSRWPRCMLENVSRWPLVRNGVQVAWQKLMLERLQVVTVATMDFRNCRLIALVSPGGHDACQNLLFDRLQLDKVSKMHGRNYRQITFSQTQWPRRI